MLLLCSSFCVMLSQSGTTEWFRMKKQHLKPMVKVNFLSNLVRFMSRKCCGFVVVYPQISRMTLASTNTQTFAKPPLLQPR